MANLTELPNIGAHAAGQLPEDLVALGAEQAWLKLQAIDPGVCLHQLYALEGAVQGILKKELDPARKQELKDFLNAHKPA